MGTFQASFSSYFLSSGKILNFHANLNFDIFVTLQNGNLIDIFGDDKKTNVSVYSEFKFYKALIKTMDNKNVEVYLNKAVRAYENFIEYINDENVVIDHEYLWDFLSLKRTNDNLGGMFKSGLNLVILNSPDDDITNKLELIYNSWSLTNNLESGFFCTSSQS